MQTKHTPATWHICQQVMPHVKNIRIVDKQQLCLDKEICTIGNTENANANAKLIVAAPDLLAACQRFMEFFEQTKNEYKSNMVLQIENAIKKATE